MLPGHTKERFGVRGPLDGRLPGISHPDELFARAFAVDQVTSSLQNCAVQCYLPTLKQLSFAIPGKDSTALALAFTV